MQRSTAFTILPDLIPITIVPRAYRKIMKQIQQLDGKCLIFPTSDKQVSKHVSPTIRALGRTISEKMMLLSHFEPMSLFGMMVSHHCPDIMLHLIGCISSSCSIHLLRCNPSVMALGRTGPAIRGALRRGAFAVVQGSLGTPPIESFVYIICVYMCVYRYIIFMSSPLNMMPS